MEWTRETSSYKTVLEELILKKGVKPGLERMKHLDRELGFPSRGYPSIHIAGTNGKGSVATKIAHALTALGYKTALYTSPHISSFRERIQIDGQWISEKRMEETLSEVVKISSEASFFEIVTMTAFLYFMQEKVDYAVIETGLGGSFDATNIVSPELSIITSISYDHQEILGNTLEQIAENKAGIIKHRTPVVLAASAALQPMFTKALEMQAPIHFMPKIEDWAEENRLLAKKGLSILFPNVEEFAIDVMPPCRFEVVRAGDATLLFDVAHNIDGIKRLFAKIEKIFPHKEISLIFGMSASKDVASVASFLSDKFVSLYLHESEHPRLLSSKAMRSFFSQAEESFDCFFAKAQERNHLIVITGSFFIMKEWKERFGFSLPEDPLLLSD